MGTELRMQQGMVLRIGGWLLMLLKSKDRLSSFLFVRFRAISTAVTVGTRIYRALRMMLKRFTTFRPAFL